LPSLEIIGDSGLDDTHRSMRVVEASQLFEGSVHEAEAVWYDTARWPRWVLGLAQVEQVSEGWPGVGAQVRWQSVPAGRGRVVEQVISYEPLSGQAVEVEDDSIRGRQTVSFSPQDANVAVALTLAYELKQRSPVMPLVDLLFIRRAMTRALEQTLSRFGAELEAARLPGVE
jgi:Polyketide cyclase / dehydrase and lipid transport